jgi:hypothetical protein
VETWIALAITAGGTIGGTATGALIALKGARSLNKDERIAAERAENLRAFRLFVAEMVLSVSELRQLPPVPKSWPTDRVIELVERPLRGGKAGMHMATKSRIYKRYGDRYVDLAGRLGVARVDLMMRHLPPNVDAAVQRASDYVKCHAGADRRMGSGPRRANSCWSRAASARSSFFPWDFPHSSHKR